MIADTSWMERRNCAGLDPEAFFAGRDDAATARVAMRVCQRCPVMAECRAWGDTVEDSRAWGVLGGEWARDRDKRRGHRKADAA